ncbi:hypothetical protein [Sulfuriflexus mobilis]|uniref:hypothetical protein n=1 Tax=Sulfuriflexus mobilis TaxID=1811807 RepID=UPI000F825404|nr:hypothetical protein [Sulfuriflexus mobilis]
MKMPNKLHYAAMVLILGFSVNASYAGNSVIPEVDIADLAVLAGDAAEKNKQLMIVYYQDECAVCNDINLGTDLDDSYMLYKTDVSAGFNVICPNGEEFANNEFMFIKGISKLPAVIFTDRLGNVAIVENAVNDKASLVSAAEKNRSHAIAALQ